MNYPVSEFDIWGLAWEENLISDEIAVYLQSKVSVASPSSLQLLLLSRLNHGQILGACLKLTAANLATSYSVGAIAKQWIRTPSLPVSEASNLLENLGVNFNQRVLLEMLKLNPQKRTYFSISAIAPANVTTNEFHTGLAHWQYRAPQHSSSGSLLVNERGFWNLSYGNLVIAWTSSLQRNLTQTELTGLRSRGLIGLPGYLFFIGRLVGQASSITAVALQQIWGISLIEAARAVVTLGNTDAGLSPDFWVGVSIGWVGFLPLTQQEYDRTKSMYRAHGLLLQQLRLENSSGAATQVVDLGHYQQKYYPISNPVPYELRLARSTLISYLCKLHELGLLTLSYSSFRLVQT